MLKILLRHFRPMLVGITCLLLLVLFTACAGTGNSTSSGGTTSPTATVGSSSGTPGTTVTQQPAVTPQPTQTQPTVAFKAGGISFIGTAKSVNSSSLVMSAPNGQTYTLKISPQTDRSAYSGNLPPVGSLVDMDSAVNPDGSFTATILKPGLSSDPDLHNIAYTGITTSAVGADRVLHFTVGTKSYTFTIPATADLTDFGGNAQAIGNNVSVKVKVQVPANTVVSVGNPNGSSTGG